MPFNRVKFILFITGVAVAATLNVQAEEGEGAAPAAGSLPKDQKEYVEKAAKLNTLSARIEENEKQFHNLIVQKAKEPSHEEKQKILTEMVEVAKQRNKDVEDYNRIKADLTYRYPNEGEHLNRRYQTQAKKSIEDLEGTAGLDELLTSIKKVIDRKFAPLKEAANKDKDQNRQPASAQEEAPKRLRLEK